jgi:hypothetical protein
MECLNVRYAAFLILGRLALTCRLKQLPVFGACRLACCNEWMNATACKPNWERPYMCALCLWPIFVAAH